MIERKRMHPNGLLKMGMIFISVHAGRRAGMGPRRGFAAVDGRLAASRAGGTGCV